MVLNNATLDSGVEREHGTENLINIYEPMMAEGRFVDPEQAPFLREDASEQEEYKARLDAMNQASSFEHDAFQVPGGLLFERQMSPIERDRRNVDQVIAHTKAVYAWRQHDLHPAYEGEMPYAA